MNNKKDSSVYKKSMSLIILLAVVSVVLLIYFTGIQNKKRNNVSKDFVSVSTENELFVDDDQILTTYEEYQLMFGGNELKEEDFIINNFLIIPLKYNSCGAKDLLPTDYKIKGNKIDITVKYEAKCGVCAPETYYYLLKIDKDITKLKSNIEYEAINEIDCPTDVAWKPIIYLYPKEKTDVSVKLLNSDNLITTYPKYNDLWNVTAYPDGKLLDKKTNRELYGLYWEGKNHTATMKNDGFVVAGEDTISFLEDKLKVLGLTEREADEFIIFWLPKLEENKYNYIRFETVEEINTYMPLEISPKPDTVIRILMDYKPLDKKINVKEQILTTPKRNGFTVVEWGGSLIQ